MILPSRDHDTNEIDTTSPLWGCVIDGTIGTEVTTKIRQSLLNIYHVSMASVCISWDLECWDYHRGRLTSVTYSNAFLQQVLWTLRLLPMGLRPGNKCINDTATPSGTVRETISWVISVYRIKKIPSIAMRYPPFLSGPYCNEEILAEGNNIKIHRAKVWCY